MKKILILTAIIILISITTFADDVTIDSSGNMTTGTSATDGNLEVIGSSGEDGIVGSTSGTGAAGVYGVNTTNSNYGILGYDTYGVYGFSSSGYAGYFQGDARVTGNLTVDGTLTGYTETDPVFSAWDKNTGIFIIESQITDLDHFTSGDETDPTVNTLGKASLSCSNNQVAKWSGSAWQCADDSGTVASYAGVAVVATGSGDYTNPLTAMTDIASWCGTPTVSNPCLLKIMPGVYNIGANNLQMQEYVDIEGSGEKVTRITGNKDNYPGVVVGANNAEIRFITVEHTGNGSYAYALSMFNAGAKVTNVTAIAASGANESVGFDCEVTSTAVFTNVTAITSGVTAALGFYIDTASPTIINANATATDSALNLGIDMNPASSPLIMNTTATALRGVKNHGIHINGASSPTIINVKVTASGGSSENYGIYNINGSNSVITNSMVEASGTNSYAVYTENFGQYASGSIKIDNSVIKGATNAVYTYPTFTTLIGSTRIEGSVTGTGTYQCAGVYNASYTFYPGPGCP